MVNVKVNLTILLQGGTMMSEGDCSKEVQKPVLVERGKYKGKQKKDKDGNPMFRTVRVPDPDKLDHHTLRVSYKDDKIKKVVYDTISFGTRKTKPAKQVLNICEEAYDYYTSPEVPDGYRAPFGFKGSKKMAPAAYHWLTLSREQRLEWHLNRIAESMKGKVLGYTVFND